jgi:hypothetical protein
MSRTGGAAAMTPRPSAREPLPRAGGEVVVIGNACLRDGLGREADRRAGVADVVSGKFEVEARGTYEGRHLHAIRTS